MACFLYCVSLSSENLISNLVGVAEQTVLSHQFQQLRIYWSEVSSPEALLEGLSRRAAEQKHRAVLREIVTQITPLSFPYPSAVADIDELEKLLGEQRDYYTEALTRLAGTVQYELNATLSESKSKDLATPVSGKEYLRRRQESELRVAAIDSKLKAVTSGIVLDWQTRRERRNHRWYALMPRHAREEFIAALRSAGPSEGARLKLSGPWPPDEFANFK